MKKGILIVAALAALSLVSCRRDDVLSTDSAEDVIGFVPYMERARTKVNVHDVVNYNSNLPWSLHGFKVMSYLEGTATPYFESVQKATAKSSTSSGGAYYTTEHTYYWPTSEALDFFAYSSEGAGTVTNTAGTASLAFTASTTPSDSLYGRDDFVAACVLGASNSGDDSFGPGTSAQALTFGHVMSKVNKIEFKAYFDVAKPYNDANYRFTVLETKMTGLKSSGTYTFNPATAGQNWSGLSGSFTHTFSNILNEADASSTFLGNQTKSLRVKGLTISDSGVSSRQWTDDKLIVIPQTVTLQVKYKLERKVNGSTWVEIMGATTKSANIKMDMGKAYNLTLALTNDGDMIVFAGEVEKWEEDTSPHYIEGGKDFGPGIECAGIVWAPVNCGASVDSIFGLCYQWGRKYGQKYQYSKTQKWEVPFPSGDIVSFASVADGNNATYKNKLGAVRYDSSVSVYNHNWWPGTEMPYTLWNANGANPDALPVKTENDPCPDGWRVPTGKELDTLRNYINAVMPEDPDDNPGFNSYFATLGDEIVPEYVGYDGLHVNIEPDWDEGVLLPRKNYVFFPASGRITSLRPDYAYTDYSYVSDMRQRNLVSAGFYWSSTLGNRKIWEGSGSFNVECVSAKILYLRAENYVLHDGEIMCYMEPAAALSVRCVQEVLLK